MKKKPGVIFVIIGFFVLYYGEVRGADWKYLGSNEEQQFYLDTGSISLLSKNIVRVWTKAFFTDRGIIGVIKQLGIKYENLSESVGLDELNCVNKTYRQLSETHFSKGGTVLGSSERGDFKIDSKWSLIIPGTFYEAIYDEVCNRPEIKEMIATHAEAMKSLEEKNKKDEETFLADNEKKEGVKTLPSGLQYKVIQAGTGKKPNLTDTVMVHYRGTLVDGIEFDSSYRRGQPATFPVSGVIPGWTEALQLMEVGSKWQLFVPSKLAYGERGAGRSIEPNATLIFEIELISIQERK